MRVLIVHNYYRSRGGEDESVDQWNRVLQERGHAVEVLSKSNRDMELCSRIGRLCVGRSVWRGVRFKCYHTSAVESLAVALMVTLHRRLRTWTRCVDGFVTVSEFAKRKLIEGRFVAERLCVVPAPPAADTGTGPDA